MKHKWSERFREWREERERRRAEGRKSTIWDATSLENEWYQKWLLEEGFITQEELEFAIAWERLENERRAEVGDACLCSICPVECPRAMGWESDSETRSWSCSDVYRDKGDKRR